MKTEHAGINNNQARAPEKEEGRGLRPATRKRGIYIRSYTSWERGARPPEYLFTTVRPLFGSMYAKSPPEIDSNRVWLKTTSNQKTCGGHRAGERKRTLVRQDHLLQRINIPAEAKTTMICSVIVTLS
jgi:hypothetical protein